MLRTKWLVKTRVKGRDHVGQKWGINRNSTYEQNKRRTHKSRKNILKARKCVKNTRAV